MYVYEINMFGTQDFFLVRYEQCGLESVVLSLVSGSQCFSPWLEPAVPGLREV